MAANGGVRRALSTEAESVLHEGIGLLLTRWTALRAAVENEWGGRDSRQIADLLVSDVLSFFTQSKEPLYIDDLENILEEALLSLNTMAEDGSIEEVAEKLMILHEECLEGNYQSVEKMKRANSGSAARANVTKVSNENDDEDEDDDDDQSDNEMDHTMKVMVDAPAQPSNSSSTGMVVDEPRSNPVPKVEDGWTVVSSRRGKGKRN